jgi:hypothetical protein
MLDSLQVAVYPDSQNVFSGAVGQTIGFRRLPCMDTCATRTDDVTREVSRVAQQCLETEVHVLLDMAVKQRRPRLVGGKVHAGAAVGGHHHRVLDHA